MWVKRANEEEKANDVAGRGVERREIEREKMQRSVCAVCEGVNDEKLCRPRLVRSPGYETARRIDGQTDEKNEWPFLPERRRARRSVITSISLFLYLTLSSPLSLSRPKFLRDLGEKNGSPRYRREKE